MVYTQTSHTNIQLICEWCPYDLYVLKRKFPSLASTNCYYCYCHSDHTYLAFLSNKFDVNIRADVTHGIST